MFTILYLSATLVVVPLLSPRTALPLRVEEGLGPVTVWTCLLNRHYVVPQLESTVKKVASDLGLTVQYMDAGFPFFDGFPLLPHRSHDDGKKLDLAFQYGPDALGSEELNLPTWPGYGSFVDPQRSDGSLLDCERVNPFYSMCRFIPITNQGTAVNDERTARLIRLLADRPEVGKIFIEPYLKARWRLTSQKIRFHGCAAVRHDDHIHIQL